MTLNCDLNLGSCMHGQVIGFARCLFENNIRVKLNENGSKGSGI